jgi:23S rRNA (cytidine1920-2'-O)/16S rRNA (cytidine1409-2'-O)-methyltransferase
MTYVGRGGDKLAWALDALGVEVAGKVCCDLGSNVGGFVDCLLQRGAVKVYSVDTSYCSLAWKLRTDPRVVVLERTNALHVKLPEPVALVTSDVGWTKQEKILPVALNLITPDGLVVALLKPQYEAERRDVRRGTVNAEAVPAIVEKVSQLAAEFGELRHPPILSPFRGGKGNNPEYYFVVAKKVSGVNDSGLI